MILYKCPNLEWYGSVGVTPLDGRSVGLLLHCSASMIQLELVTVSHWHDFVQIASILSLKWFNRARPVSQYNKVLIQWWFHESEPWLYLSLIWPVTKPRVILVWGYCVLLWRSDSCLCCKEEGFSSIDGVSPQVNYCSISLALSIAKPTYCKWDVCHILEKASGNWEYGSSC